MQKRILQAVLIASSLLAGCATVTPGQSSQTQMGNLLLAEPAPVNYRSQVALARINQVLSQVERNLSDVQRAQLYYERAVLYDSLGLKGLAQYDFNVALKFKPDMAEAYNYIGIHYTEEMEFAQAYEAFDSTLDINPEHDFAFLNRGIALYYGGRAELAYKDLTVFYELDSSDPYRALWAYIVESEINKEQAFESLKQAREKLSNDNWATLLVDLYLEKINENTLLGKLLEGVSNQQQLTDKLCEAYFYLGKYHAARGNNGVASNYFKLALSTNVYQFVEHRYARLELDLMRERAFSEVEK
ncbi:lipoprotein NlpI [Alteromonadaceae bacterium M269]|nr:lipoprotein NlpI [Alteromonadaceae bacterium M269]